MKKTSVLFFALLMMASVNAQTNDTSVGTVTVTKDPRLDVLAKEQYDYNKATVGLGTKAAKGYRLLVVNSNDRTYAMKVRAELLQHFPEQKVYMSFQAPFIKLKFGNFVDKDEAERYRKLLTSYKIVTSNIYTVTEIVEVKADKTKDNDDN